MSVALTPPPPAGRARTALVLCALGLALVFGAAIADTAPVVTLGALVLVVWAAVTHKFFLSWRVLLLSLTLIVLFIPIGRYALPGSAGFQLEPYRVMVAGVTVMWIGSMLVQPATRYTPSGLGLPSLAIIGTMLASDGLNSSRVHDLGLEMDIVKSLTFYVSFFVVGLFTNAVISNRRDLDAMLKTLVASGGILGLLTIIESRTGFTPFDSLGTFIPILEFQGNAGTLEQRGGDFRALASAQHPIALGALLALLVPVAVAVARRHGGKIWWTHAGLLAIGVLTTVARTATLMLFLEIIVLLVLKPRVMFKLWPWALPFLVVVHFAVPGTIGSLKSSFFPRGGLIAEQQSGAGTYGSNRLADLGPSLQAWKRTPWLGQGFGTRISERTNPKMNASILDDQWLGSLLETGILGVLALLWLFVRSIRRLGRQARRLDDEDGWLLASLCAALAAFAFGMVTFDAFAFTQMIIVVFMLLGVGAAALRITQPAPDDVSPLR